MLNKPKLRAFMAEQKIGVAELGEKMGTSKQYISDIRNKENVNCSINFLARLIVALNECAKGGGKITADDLIIYPKKNTEK